MGNILNLEDVGPTRVYDKEKKFFENDLLADNSGGMSEKIESNIDGLQELARTKMKKRTATHDWKTKNKSFLNLYNTLYKLGVKNNKFFLKIYDRDLIGIDVYKGIIPEDIQIKVLLEIIINPWYFLREICRIPVDGLPIEPGGGSEFIADRNNIASWYCYLNGIDHYDSKARQLGKTQNDIAEFNYAFHFGSMSSTILFFNKDFGLAKQNLYRLKCQRDMLPKWLQMRIAYKDDGSVDKGQDSITQMKNPITGNVIKVMAKATSRDNAIKMGRGETAALYYNDEFDFTPYNTDIKDAAAFAYSTASKNAKTHRSLYNRIFSSTPGYLSTKEGKAADKFIKRMLPWSDKFYDEPIQRLKNTLASKSYNGVMYIEHTWRQLGKSIEWYENQCSLVDYDTDIILREIDLQRIQGNEASPFKKSALTFITRNMKTPINEINLTNNIQPIKIYEKLNRKIHYVLSVDPAEGLGQNNNGFTLINPHTEMVAAEYKSPYISPGDFFRMLCDFMDEYCPKSMLVIENNRGRELINRFMESKYRYSLWYDKSKLTDKKVLNTDKYGAEKKAAYDRRALGFNTSPSTKPLLYSIIERFMEEDLTKVCTEYIVKDVTAVQRKPNGKIVLGGATDDDEEGEDHGDVLMAYLIGLFVLYNADNLHEFGVEPGTSSPEEANRELTDQEKKEKIRSLMGILPDDLKGLFQGVLLEKDPVVASQQYEVEVQRHIRQRDLETGKMDDIDMRFQGEEVDNAMWEQTQRAIFDGYDERESDPNRRFDVNDWI